MPSGLAADLGPRRRRQPSRSILGLFQIRLFPPKFPACSIRGGDRWCRGRARTRAGTRVASFPGADGAVLCSSAPKSSPDAIRVGPSPKKNPTGAARSRAGTGLSPRGCWGHRGHGSTPIHPTRGRGEDRLQLLSAVPSAAKFAPKSYFLLFFFFPGSVPGAGGGTRGPFLHPKGNFTARRGSGPSSLTSRCQWCPGEAPKRRKTTQKNRAESSRAASTLTTSTCACPGGAKSSAQSWGLVLFSTFPSLQIIL